jgi:hypothetical protein
MLRRVRAFMRKRDELFRNVPANIYELRLALAGLPQDMKVLAEPETGVATQAQPEISGQDSQGNLTACSGVTLAALYAVVDNYCRANLLTVFRTVHCR